MSIFDRRAGRRGRERKGCAQALRRERIAVAEGARSCLDPDRMT
jgi:hypothetical protein